MKKRTVFGLLGCGRIGERHARQMSIYGTLEAVCDIDEAKANALALQYKARAYYTLQSFLAAEAQLDLVAICTPNGYHAQHTIQVLKAGFHVLCEKPLALTSADCRQMIDIANQNDRHLFVVKQNRFNPPVQAVKRMLDQGKLGKIYSVQLNCFWNRDNAYYSDNWHGTREFDGGILFTQFSHFIDLLYWYFGDVSDVKAFGRNFAHSGSIEFDDTVTAIAVFQSGPVSTMHFSINATGRNMEGSLTIFGEKGTVKIGGQYLNKLEYNTFEDPRLMNLEKAGPANDYGTYSGSMSNHDLVYQNLINVLANKELPVADIHHGMKTIEIIEQIMQACNR